MHPHLSLPQPFLHHGRALAIGAAALLSAGMWTLHIVRTRRPTPAQIEERRRTLLSAHGRIIDGVLIGAQPSEDEPGVVFYTYRVGGVRYECSQNIAALPACTLHLDSPIQVRYSPQNPGNSIVLSETWNGLW